MMRAHHTAPAPRPLAALLLLALAPVACLSRDEGGQRSSSPPAGTVPAQVRLVWTESPQSRVTVSWTTAEEGEVHRVHHDTEPRGGVVAGYRHRTDCQRNGQFSSARPELYYHHATLDGLEPSTTYYLVMESDGNASREFHFRTAPDDGRAVAILQGGDSRSDRTTRRRVNELVARLTAEDEDVLAFAHGGDYVYNGLSLAQWSVWLTDHELTVTDGGRLLPIIPARGNHEAFGALFDEVFAWPGGGFGKNFFATRLGPDVLLVTLNSETAAGGRQAAFLRQCLERAGDVRWKVAQYHRPIWPAVKVPAHGKRHWQPLFDRHGVDLVCESDGHVLKRTVPIVGDRRDPAGTVYIGEGGLGVPQRTPNAGLWYLQPPGTSASAHHVWKLRFAPDALTMAAIAVDGSVVDRHQLQPRR